METITNLHAYGHACACSKWRTKVAILTNLCMFGVILKVIHLGTGLCNYPNYREEKIQIFCPKKKQDIFHSSCSRHSSGPEQRSHQQLSLSLPGTGWKSSSRESVLLLCQGKGAGLALQPCVNSLPPLPLGQGWVRQPTKWSFSHSSVYK